ncbi:MAG: hypothetical protein ACI8XZ_000578 [Gammaproteobacteria bacterium]|jgi:hypothetical protein
MPTLRTALAVLFTSLFVASFNAQAALVDNGAFTTDTVNQLDWLDLTETANESFDTVAGRIAPLGDLFGWSFATQTQVTGLFDSAGGAGSYPQTGSSANAPATLLLGLWGTLSNNTEFNTQQSLFLTEESSGVGLHSLGFIEAFDNAFGPGGSLDSSVSVAGDFTSQPFIGSALVRPSIVPIPAAVWLFGSALGLLGWRHRKAA